MLNKKTFEYENNSGGGGYLGHTSAAILSSNENVVVDLLTSAPEKWNHSFITNMPDGSSLLGKLDKTTNKAEDVIPYADWVFLCLPFMVVYTIRYD